MCWSPVEIDGVRAAKNVRLVTAAVFDLDTHTDDELAALATHIEGYTYIVHTTHTHKPPNEQSLRLILALSRSCAAAEWPTLYSRLVEHFALKADSHCKDVSRLYFLPTSPIGASRFAHHAEGRVVDVDAMLAPRSKLVETPPDEVRDILRAARLRYAKAKDDEKHAMLDAVLLQRPLATPGNRDARVHLLGSTLAFVAAGVSFDSLLATVRPAIAAMETLPEGLDYWLDKFALSYRKAFGRKEENAKLFAERLVTIAPTTPKDWRDRLIKKPEGGLKSCGFNVSVLLEHHPDTVGALRFDVVSKTVLVESGRFKGEPLTTLDISVSNWLQEQFAISANTFDVGQQILRVARANAVDPLAMWLESLVWDKTPRAASFLRNYFHARAEGADGESLEAHLASLSTKWLISCVARALQPGSKVDTVLVVEGPQGIKKSTAFEILGGRWFCNTQIVLGDKDSMMLPSRYWIVELAELSSLRGTQIELQKAFLSRRVDSMRPPYGRVIEEFLRRCVFVGTTNDDKYLVDETGNRRFLTVRSRRVEVDALKADREQLWAEAVVLYKSGAEWWLDCAEQKTADDEARERLIDNTLETRLLEWWLATHPSKRQRLLTSSQIAQSALMLSVDRINRSLEVEIGRAMHRLGFEKARRRVAGRLVWFFSASDEMLVAPQQIGSLKVMK